MNGLSWLILWAGWCESIKGALVGIGVVTGIGAALGIVAGAIGRDTYRAPEYPAGWIRLQITSAKTAVFVIPTVIVLYAVIPTKETVYMIAASEMGEKAIQTPEFVKLRAVINTWLDKAAKPVEPAK